MHSSAEDDKGFGFLLSFIANFRKPRRVICDYFGDALINNMFIYFHVPLF